MRHLKLVQDYEFNWVINLFAINILLKVYSRVRHSKLLYKKSETDLSNFAEHSNVVIVSHFLVVSKIVRHLKSHYQKDVQTSLGIAHQQKMECCQ